MSTSNLVIVPKAHNLNISPDLLKDLKPYFQFSSRSCSSQVSSKKFIDGKWVEDGSHDAKSEVDIVLRDANTGDLIGRGHFECNPDNENRDKYEEKVTLRSITGQEIGTATLDVSRPKGIESGHGKNKSIEHEFRHMRKAFGGMMNQANRMFKDFSRNYYNDENFGHELTDDWLRPSLTSGEEVFFPEFRLEGKRKNSPKKHEAIEHPKKHEAAENKKEAHKEKRDVEPERRSGKRDIVDESRPAHPEVEISEEKLKN